MRTRSPKPFLRFLTSITLLPRRGPGGMAISSKSSFRVPLRLDAISLPGPDGPSTWSGGLGVGAHPLEFFRAAWQLASFLPWTSRRAAFFSR